MDRSFQFPAARERTLNRLLRLMVWPDSVAWADRVPDADEFWAAARDFEEVRRRVHIRETRRSPKRIYRQ